ncbi:LysR family transcriptional regulator [Frateuria aurantia]
MNRLNRRELGDLHLFRQIAESGGFRKAAAELDLSPSALSHALRGLEARCGVKLFNRSNRSVTLTAAGTELLARLQAGFAEIEGGLEGLNRYREHPAGRLRLNVPADAARLVLAPSLAEYGRRFPDVRLEIVVQDNVVDIVRAGFDAGIRYGGHIPEDMIAVALGPPRRWITVASKDYLASRPPLLSPADLAHHACIGIRMGSGLIYHWELERGTERVLINQPWAQTVNETMLSIELAETGAGIIYCLEDRVDRQLANGSLVQVLPEWSSMGPAFHLYYPDRRQLPQALRALLDLLLSHDRS